VSRLMRMAIVGTCIACSYLKGSARILKRPPLICEGSGP
jgi:hypothetical protein